MRFLSLLLLASLALPAAAAPVIRVVNEAQLPAATVEQLRQSYARWAKRLYAYHQLAKPEPVNLVLSRRVGIGYYYAPNVYLPPDDDPDEMLETWIHELAHHATGHQSRFFFKEGIATHTLEALFAEDGRMPQGFPQYGQSNDAWVSLFDRRGQLPALRELIARERYDSSSEEADFRSWQVYIVGASFIGWLIRNEGYEAFREVFWEEELGAKGPEWERRWLASIRARQLPVFAAAAALPNRARYRSYARRLGR